MTDKDAYRRHNWEVTDTQRFTNGILETETCTKCNARRTLQIPPGMIVWSDPKPVPKYCHADSGQQYTSVLQYPQQCLLVKGGNEK